MDAREEGPDEVFLIQQLVAALLEKDPDDDHEAAEAEVEREAEGDQEVHLLQSQLKKDEEDCHLLDHLSQPNDEEEDQMVEENVVEQGQRALCQGQLKQQAILCVQVKSFRLFYYPLDRDHIHDEKY